jgi:hypothetical protein
MIEGGRKYKPFSAWILWFRKEREGERERGRERESECGE